MLQVEGKGTSMNEWRNEWKRFFDEDTIRSLDEWCVIFWQLMRPSFSSSVLLSRSSLRASRLSRQSSSVSLFWLKLTLFNRGRFCRKRSNDKQSMSMVSIIRPINTDLILSNQIKHRRRKSNKDLLLSKVVECVVLVQCLLIEREMVCMFEKDDDDGAPEQGEDGKEETRFDRTDERQKNEWIK